MGNAVSSEDEGAAKRKQSSLKESGSNERRAHSHSPRPSCKVQGTLDLSLIQIHLIQKMWASVIKTRGYAGTGSCIFHGIFTKAPRAKTFFQHQTAHNFQPHFIDFAEAIDYVIKNLENEDEVSDFLFQLGAKHAEIRDEIDNVEFDPKLWNVFGESMMRCTIDWGTRQQRNKLFQSAWTAIVLFIIEKMKDGYYSKMRHRSKSMMASPQHIQAVAKSNLLQPEPMNDAYRRHSAHQ